MAIHHCVLEKSLSNLYAVSAIPGCLVSRRQGRVTVPQPKSIAAHETPVQLVLTGASSVV